MHIVFLVEVISPCKLIYASGTFLDLDKVWFGLFLYYSDMGIQAHYKNTGLKM